MTRPEAKAELRSEDGAVAVCEARPVSLKVLPSSESFIPLPEANPLQSQSGVQISVITESSLQHKVKIEGVEQPVSQLTQRTTEQTTLFQSPFLAPPVQQPSKYNNQPSEGIFSSTTFDFSFSSSYEQAAYRAVKVEHESLNEPASTLRDLQNSYKRQQVQWQILPEEDLYQAMTRKVIEGIFEIVGYDSGVDIRILRRPQTLSHVANVVKDFMVCNRSQFTVSQSTQEMVVQDTSDETLKRRSRDLRKLVEQREKVSKMLAFTSRERYSNIIPFDIVIRLEELRRCIANDKTAKNQEGKHKATQKSARKKKTGKKGEVEVIANNRCKNLFNAHDSEAALDLIKKLADLPRPCELSTVAKILFKLIEVSVCSTAHRSKARFGLHKLCYHFYQSVGAEQEALRKTELVQLENWLTEIAQSFIAEDEQDLAAETDSEELSVYDFDETSSSQVSNRDIPHTLTVCSSLLFEREASFKQDLGFNTKEFQTVNILTHMHLRKFKWREDPQDISVKALVDKVARSPLTRKDREDMEGSMSIGMKGASERLESWRAQCGYKICEHADLLDFEREVRHPKRVENLIHAEFEQRRHEEPECGGCGGSHTEWFEIEAREAQVVIKKWTQWMQREDPYDEAGIFKTGVELPEMNEQNTLVDAKIDGGKKSLPLRRSSRISRSLGGRR